MNLIDKIKKILEITKYPGDYEEFIEYFLKNIYADTLLRIMLNNPVDEIKDLFKALVENPTDEAILTKAIKENIIEEDLQFELKNSLREALELYIESMTPSLSEDQFDELEEFIKSEEDSS